MSSLAAFWHVAAAKSTTLYTCFCQLLAKRYCLLGNESRAIHHSDRPLREASIYPPLKQPVDLFEKIWTSKVDIELWAELPGYTICIVHTVVTPEDIMNCSSLLSLRFCVTSSILFTYSEHISASLSTELQHYENGLYSLLFYTQWTSLKWLRPVAFSRAMYP